MKWTLMTDQGLYEGYSARVKGLDVGGDPVARVEICSNHDGSEWSVYVFQARSSVDTRGYPFIEGDEDFFLVTASQPSLKAAKKATKAFLSLLRTLN